MLKIFNTLSRKKEIFKPISTNNIVNIYVCGVTVYDFCHIGHARTFVVFDCIVRYLRYCGYIVNYVRNITDIDDKIIQHAMKHGETIQSLVGRMITAMNHDFDSLHILRPNHEPRVTQHINDIIKLINSLIRKKHAYIAPNGDVLFSIDSKKNYNSLSCQDTKKLRIRNLPNNNAKRNPMDFVLWKMSKRNYDQILHESSWISPWGLGRPGWHIECSAISHALLGKHFDIHGGGMDLIFPHHENEIAQSTSVYNTPYANFWIHVGLVMYNHEKMSKSLKNFFTIREVLKYYDYETIRFFLMSAHYRSQIQYTEDNLKRSRLALEHLYTTLQDTDQKAEYNEGDYFIEKFHAEMNNDFNTPGAYSVLFELSHLINRLKNKKSLKYHNMAATLRYLGGLLGLLNQNPNIFLQKTGIQQIIYTDEIIESLIQERNSARKNKQWELADHLRDKLLNLGIILEDTNQGTKWRCR